MHAGSRERVAEGTRACESPLARRYYAPRPRAASGGWPRGQAWKADAFVRAADDAVAGKPDDPFPQHAHQTWRGTESNIDADGVPGNRAIPLLGGELTSQKPVHSNDVNMGPSASDSFPAAIPDLEGVIILGAQRTRT